MKNKIYIQSAAHISAQKPLSETWMETPQAPVSETWEVDYKEYLAPNVARRMGKLLKRALVCSRVAMERAHVDCPDAIISTTGLGCIMNTEVFLDAEERNGENLLNPTPFMLSTHNTIGSTIAIDTHCKGYNTHYSQKFVSFDCGLLDACMQLQREEINTVLLNGNDESSPVFDKILRHLDQWNFKVPWFKGESAISMVLSKKEQSSSLCRIDDMMMCCRMSNDKLKKELEEFLNRNGCCLSELDALFVGLNGHEKNDRVYFEWAENIFSRLPLVYYKHLFGEHYTMSGMGLYVAAICLSRGMVPNHLILNSQDTLTGLKRVLFCNHSADREYSFVLLGSKNREI
ncbi:MAG: beta-ketoacyl synthase chain length factor [Bacteroides sp.]|nr:beta-ketoacyl synthase chain length factor [Bacteroides sp.]MCM1084874.1 beta-ketoacyl synthase chain length factor [Bacteroides sp.]